MADDVCILQPAGRLDSGSGPQFEDRIAKAMAGDTDKLLLDLAGLEYISSAGLRIVLHTAKQMKAKGGRLVLCSLSDQIREVFDISGFSSILDICVSRDEAMARLTA
jgi:anti-anti-sigma factor